MTFLISSAIAIFLIMAFLIWCFRGFSREIQQVKNAGLLVVRPVVVEKADRKPHARKLIQMPGQPTRSSRQSGADQGASRKVAGLIGIALLVAARSAQ